MEGLNESKQSRVTDELIQDIKQKYESLEGFLDYLLFKIFGGYRQRMNNYISITLKQKNNEIFINPI